MEDEDGEGSNVDSWPIPEQLSCKETSYANETLKRPNNSNDYIDGVEENKEDTQEDKTNSKVIFKGFKKRILAQTQENQIPDRLSTQEICPATSPKSSRDRNIEGKCGKITEYAQYLGLQPAGKYKCPKCNPAVTFRSMSMLKQHQCVCQPSNPQQGLPGTSEQHGTSLSSSSTSNFRITRKVYLCSACGTYFENWNLFLHMREIHKRHICLFCLGMFGQAERLSHHLAKKHSVPETNFNSVDDFYAVFKGSCYLICCTCEKVFSETDNFYNHHCTSTTEKTSLEVCSVCRQTGGTHSSSCQLASDLERGTITNDRIQASDSEQTLFPNPANAVAKRLLGAARGRLKNSEKALLSSYQRKLGDMYARKMSLKPQRRSSDVGDSDCEVRGRSSRDTVAETIMEVSKSRRDMEKSRILAPETLKERREIVEIDMTKSPAQERTPDRYTDTIMKVSRCSDDSDSNDESRIEEIERINSCDDTPDDMEQGELILDDGRDDSSNESLPNNSPVRSVVTPVPERKETTPITPPTPPPLAVEPKLNSSNSTVEEEEGEEEQEDEEEEEEEVEEDITSESPVKESQNISVSRVNSTNRSLVIKICTNKNSQFSVATPNGNGSFLNDNEEEEEEENDEDAESEENNNAGDFGSEKDVEASDSDSGKLAVASEAGSDHEEVPEEEPPDAPIQVEENEAPAEAEEEKEEKKENPSETKETAEQPQATTSEPTVEEETPKISLDIAPEVPEDVPVEEKPEETNKEPEEQPKESDGIILAAEDIPSIDLNVTGTLDSMEIEDLLKQCIEIASPTCVYCNHARHIAVNGKQLALHMLAEHRFQPQHPAIVLHHEQFTIRVKKSLEELESRYFNLDSYDNTRGTYSVPEVRTYECYLCRIYYSVHKELYLHNRKMHQKTILICIMCKSTFYNHSELLCHLCPGVYAANVNIRYRCCMCTIESLPSAFRLMVHLRKRHDTCDVCLESTGNQQKLSNHVWKHKLHHLCYRCGIAYRNKPDITKHLFWKHGTESVMCKKCLQKKWPHIYHFCIPPNAFVCEECGSTFSRAVALKVHKRLHTGDEPYSCPECSARFISKKLVAKHEETHRPQPELPPPVVEEPEEEIIDPCELPKTVANVEAAGVEPIADASTPKTLKEPVKKVVDVYDLPPLNLSSDSDSDNEEDKAKDKKEEEKAEDKDEVKKDDGEDKKDEECKENIEENVEIIAEEIPVDVVPTETNDSIREADESNEEEKKEEVVIMNGIWDNFKSYTASLETSEPSNQTEEDPEKNEELLKVIIAEHDYCVVYADESKESKEDGEAAETPKEPEQEEAKPAERPPTPTAATNGENDSTKKKTKSPKKKKQSQGDGAASSSSSDSSSDSDSSSCSCGTNCSCSSSSSGSSSSSSSSSDSDSSASESSPKKPTIARKDRRKERETRKNNKTTKDSPENGGDATAADAAASEVQVDIQAENGVASGDGTANEALLNVTEVSDKSLPLPEPLRESDLDTDETETDEDFYDEYPQQHANKLLAEKRNQQMLLAIAAPPSAEDSALGSSSNDMKNGTIETSNDMTNSLPAAPPPSVTPIKQQNARRKIKTKRRKKGEGRGRGRHPAAAAAVAATNQQPVVESIKLNIPKFLYRNKQSGGGRSSSPSLNSLHAREPKLPAVTYQVSQSNLSANDRTPKARNALPGSGNESSSATNENKRSSKRKRVPKRFYGDSSDEEQQRQQHTVAHKWRRLDNTVPAVPYVPTITIKQNYGPPPSSVVSQPKVYQTVQRIPEPEPAPAPSVTDSDDPPDTSSDSSASDTEQEAPPTRPHPVAHNSEGTGGGPPTNRPANLYCYCQCPYDEVSEMIACDGDNCRIEWFHFECVGIMVPPKGKWYCPDCRKRDSSLPNNEYYD